MVVNLQFDLLQVLVWLFIGLVSGFLASVVVRGRGLGTLGNIIVGLIGAVVGGFLFGLLNKSIFPAFLTTPIAITPLDLLAAFVGSVLVLVIVSVIRGRGK